MFVPCVRPGVEGALLRVCQPTRACDKGYKPTHWHYKSTGVVTEFHEEVHRCARTADRPKYDIILARASPALEEVEEKVAGFDVDVTCISPGCNNIVNAVHHGVLLKNYPDSPDR